MVEFVINVGGRVHPNVESGDEGGDGSRLRGKKV